MGKLFRIGLFWVACLSAAPVSATDLSGDGDGGATNDDAAKVSIEGRKFDYDKCDVVRGRVPSPSVSGLADWCAHRSVDGPVICVDASPAGRGATSRHGFRGDVYSAGETLTLFVRVAMTHQVDFSMCKATSAGGVDLTGTPQSADLGSREINAESGRETRGDQGDGDDQATPPPPPPPRLGVVRYEFKTYVPQRLKLRVEVFRRVEDFRVRQSFFEQSMTTVGKYSQALHIGLGATMLHAGNVTYRSEIRQGSQQRELVAEDRENIAMDIMVGYTPYIFGRPADGCAGFGCFAPYVGLSLVEISSDPKILRGLYTGLDYELHETLSIVFVAGLRRADIPREGYVVGSPIPSNVDPTIDGWRLSYGILLNLSPTILKSAVKQGQAVGVSL